MWDNISKMARSVSNALEKDVMVQSGLAILRDKISRITPSNIVSKALFQFSRITDIEKNPGDIWDPVRNEYTTVYPKFQVVLANLIGPDRVLDGQHPAIVWESTKKNATVVVIPLTSKKGTGHSIFDLGFIDELILDPAVGPKESVVVMNQIQTIPRKAINVLMKADGVTPISLDADQQIKVMDLFVHQYLNRKHDLRHVIRSVVKRVPPVDVGQTDWINDLARPVVHVFNNNVLHYMLADETWKSIPVKSLPIPIRDQRDIITDLTSTVITTRATAITRVQSILGQVQAAPTVPGATGNPPAPGVI